MFTKENTTIEYHSLVFSAHRHVSHAHRTLNLVAIWPVVTERADIFFFLYSQGAHGGTAFALLLPDRKISLSCSVCKVREGQIKHCREYAQKAKIMKKHNHLRVQISFTKISQAGSEKGM